MAAKIDKPFVLQAAGQPPKQIEEFIGRVSSATEEVSRFNSKKLVLFD
jgi:hypothetical protein